jgi:hypothetical protein
LFHVPAGIGWQQDLQKRDEAIVPLLHFITEIQLEYNRFIAGFITGWWYTLTMEQPNERLYRVFVLRWWSEAGIHTGQPVWRFSLEEVGPPHTRRAFGTVEAIMAFLQNEWRSSHAPVGTDNSDESSC